jgi:molecular chaperone Hsp33
VQEDYLIRALAKEAGVRALICVTTQIAREGAQRHGAAATPAAALGRALTAGALMGALLKIQQRVALKFEGNGPLRKLVVESNSYGKVRGYVLEPAVELPLRHDEPDVVQALGAAGLLTVVKDLRLKELAESVVPLAISDIAGDLEAYLVQSEQVPSLVQIGVRLNPAGEIVAAGGLLLQSMPPHEADSLIPFREQLQELPPIDNMLLTGQRPEAILQEIFGSTPYTILEKRPLVFQCACSWERGEKALVSLGRAELTELLEEEGEAVVECHFCHEQYIYDQAALTALLQRLAS